MYYEQILAFVKPVSQARGTWEQMKAIAPNPINRGKFHCPRQIAFTIANYSSHQHHQQEFPARISAASDIAENIEVQHWSTPVKHTTSSNYNLQTESYWTSSMMELNLVLLIAGCAFVCMIGEGVEGRISSQNDLVWVSLTTKTNIWLFCIRFKLSLLGNTGLTLLLYNSVKRGYFHVYNNYIW